MLRTIRTVGASIAFALVANGSVSVAMGQVEPGTPTSRPGTSVAHCLIEPRTLDELVVLVERREATPADALPIDLVENIPSGTHADIATVDAVTIAIEGLAACAREGDTLRLLALYTDGYLHAIGAAEPALFENLVATPVSDERLGSDLYIASIQEVTMLGDGRVSAMVTLGGVEDSHPAPGRTVLMIFANAGGRWLLDGQYERVWSGDPAVEPVPIADLIAVPRNDEATPNP